MANIRNSNHSSVASVPCKVIRSKADRRKSTLSCLSSVSALRHQPGALALSGCEIWPSVHYAVELPNDLFKSFLAIVDNRVAGSGLSVMNDPNLL
jgi:hypothetical protein